MTFTPFFASGTLRLPPVLPHPHSFFHLEIVIFPIWQKIRITYRLFQRNNHLEFSTKPALFLLSNESSLPRRARARKMAQRIPFLKNEKMTDGCICNCNLRSTIKRIRPRRTRGTDVACPAGRASSYGHLSGSTRPA